MVSTYYQIDRESILDMAIRYMPSFFKSKEEEKHESEDSENKAEPSVARTENLVYRDNYQEQRLNSDYLSTSGTYLNRRLKALHDFTDRVPGKHMHILPESIMGGVLGFTYLGDTFMARRADLTGETARMVDIHECIHTPDEYETRILTAWMMSEETDNYIR